MIEMSVRLQKSRIANLYKADNGSYYLRVMVKGKAVKKLLRARDGTPVRNFSIARLVLIQELEKMGADKAGCHWEWENVCDEYFKEYSARPELTDKTREGRKYELSWVRRAFTGKKLEEISGMEVSRWWSELCKKKTIKGTELSSRTKNRILDTMNAVFSFARTRGMIINIPASGIHPLHIPRKYKKLSPLKEFRAVIQSMREAHAKWTKDDPCAHDCHSADMVEFMAYSGARIGEARLVRLEDITSEGVIIHGIKRGNDRFVPFNSGLRQVCERLIRFHHKCGRNTKETLFQIITPRKAFERAVQRVGAPHCTMHGLRHFFITSCVEAGIVPAVIAKWVGHKDGGVLIARTYTHIRDDHGKSEAAKLNF